ncbi:hypothetical protein SteCoe_15425 [Stentor coeruleus]|uniref:Thioredoxin-like fold domain-containing protein n=1 Tax=Stentor coeruleus TaxID=5963 RepID=A0A1R2C3Q1_9CILI|nr:hypothetical protein SteCoe_15425 [Stentor coeruleus]
MEHLFGIQLESHNGPVPTSSVVFRYKLVYFSAEWSPLCNTLTSELLAFYNMINSYEKIFEVLFVSYDRNKSDFIKHFAKMPWLAINYKNKKRVKMLEKKFGVKEIPFLALIDDDGNMKNNDVRNDIMTKGLAALNAWDIALCR